MTSSRVGSLSLLTDIQRDTSVTQRRLADLQNQISSGFKSKDFAGLNGSVEQFSQVTAQINRAKQFNANNVVNVSKLQTADVALEQMMELADKMKTAMVGANGASIGSSNLVQIMGDYIKAFGSELNASFNGSYIFGGTDTYTLPVSDEGLGAVSPGNPSASYYSGAAQDATLRIDDRTEVVFPVRADDMAFQKILAAAKQAVVAAQGKDTITMGQAQQLIQEGMKDLSAVRSRVGSTVTNIEAIDSRLKTLTTYWTELSDSVSKTDIVKASTEVASQQAILQASYQVFARVSQLRLSDYL
jgi:flagellar hook-associated protein 3 FlgL